MLVTLKELLEIAEAENKAIGSFTCPNMEIAMGTIKAAEEMQSPIIIQIAEGRLKHTPLDMIGPLMVQAAKDASVKIAVHLDHGLTLAKAQEALGYGYTSVMFDGSHYSLQENIDKTNEVARVARKYGASVEAELGTIGGKEATEREEVSKYTDVEEARTFAANADIDALAVAIGNAHGHYRGIPKLNFERLTELKAAAPESPTKTSAMPLPWVSARSTSRLPAWMHASTAQVPTWHSPASTTTMASTKLLSRAYTRTSNTASRSSTTRSPYKYCYLLIL